MRTKNNGLLKFAIKDTISIDNSHVCAERMKKIRNPLKREPFACCLLPLCPMPLRVISSKGQQATGKGFSLQRGKGLSLQRVLFSKGQRVTMIYTHACCLLPVAPTGQRGKGAKGYHAKKKARVLKKYTEDFRKTSSSIKDCDALLFFL